MRTMAKVTGRRGGAQHASARPGRPPPEVSRILERVSSSLSGIPVEKRRRAAATLGLFAVLFVAMGLVALTGRTPAAVRVFAAVALTAAVLLGLTAWGLVSSIRADLAEQRLDRAVEEAVAASGVDTCGCGHDHDPDELHVSDDPCNHDGAGRSAGLQCSQTCDTCVLTALRPAASHPASAAQHEAPNEVPPVSRAERLAQ